MLFQLLSRQHDGDVLGEEARLLAALELAHPKAAEKFRRKAELLSCLLKEIPAYSIDRVLVEIPAQGIAETIVIPSSTVAPQRSGSQRVVVGVVTSLLCAGLLFAFMRPSDSKRTPVLAKAELRRGPEEARPKNGSSEEVGAIADDSSEPDIQPLIHSDNWNVVVVRIDGKDRDLAMDQIQSIVQKAGLQLKGSTGHDESRWLGVVLTSNVAGREDVVNAMEGVGASNGYVAKAPPADSQEAMFVAAARESLKHPTRSELHHGKVFVVLPSSPSVKGEELIAGAGPEVAPAGNASAPLPARIEKSGSAAKGSASDLAKISPGMVPVVTLVVFEFSEGEKSGPNNSGQQI